MAACGAVVDAFVDTAAELRLSSCECLLRPSDRLLVTLEVANPGSRPAALLIALRTPDNRWYFYSPAGLIHSPTWLTLPAGLPATSIPLLDEALVTTSLPFGSVPLVGPHRFEYVALLYDAVTGQALAPVAATFFSFEREPPAPAPASTGTLHLVPHQHNEIAWLEREDRYLSRGADFIRDAIAEATRNPEFRFVVSQKPVLESFRAKYPELTEVLRGLLDRGVAEISGGLLVEADLNLLSGESLVRQALYGQQYLEAVWGHRSRLLWEPDAFGHPMQMPQIAAKAGMPYYAFSRGMTDAEVAGGSEFEWASPDGSQVLAHFMPFGYQVGREVGQFADSGPQLNELFRLIQTRATGPELLALVGADVGQGVFPSSITEATSSWNATQVPGVRASISTPSAFFDRVAENSGFLARFRDKEFQEQPHGGTVFPAAYATRIEIKKTNARLEQQLRDAEALATLASLDGLPYPGSELRALGEALAVNQTHDYLPGTGIDEIYEDDDPDVNDFGDRASAIHTGVSAQLQASMDYLLGKMDTRSVPEARAAIVVFNALSWPRRDCVTTTVDQHTLETSARLLDGGGTEIPYQVLGGSGGSIEIAFVASLPSLGYRTFWIVPGSPAASPAERSSIVNGSASIALGGFDATVDADGLSQIRALQGGEPMLAKRAGIWWADEKYGDAYVYDPLFQNVGATARLTDPVRLDGPVMTRVVTVAGVADHSTAVEELRLIPALQRIAVTQTLYWADVNRNVFVRLPFAAVPDGAVTEGVPYGFIERRDGDYPALGWADFGNELRGTTILNQGLFGHRWSTADGERVLDITVLRSLDRAVFGDYPSTAMKEAGVHVARYAVVPHTGSWRSANAPRRAAEFQSAPFARVVSIKAGELAGERSFVSLAPESAAILSAVYRDGDDIVVRLHETVGEAGSETILLPGLTVAGVVETNLLGDPLRVHPPGDAVLIDVKSQEIVTIRLTNARGRTKS